MKKLKIWSIMVLVVIALPMMVACGGDDDSGSGSNQDVTIDENGNVSNGKTFSSIDDKNFYLDYIKYTVKEGHLVVSGYDRTGFKGVAKIVSSITFKGSHYEVLEIKEAFWNCTVLTSVTIPNSVTNIGASSFYNCTGLTSINIPNNVTSIGYEAFYGCTGLTSINIPNSIIYIDTSAFQNCTNIEKITVSDGNTKYDSRDNCNAIIETSTNALILGCKNTVIPNSVTRIGSGAFVRCTGLTSINIPNSVTDIGDGAFYGCKNLTAIHCLCTTPPSIHHDSFDTKIYDSAILYVPKGTTEAYKKAKQWEYFKNIVEE